MRVIDDLEELASALAAGPGAVVTIGVYDGVHLGHHAVLRLVRELADARGLAAVCITFDRHPAEVVRAESAPMLLTTLEQKLELLDATGFLDLAFVLHFDEARSQESADDFVREVLVGAAHARVVVVGADFHFGKGRGGDVPLLQRVGAELGFEVLGVGLEAAPSDTPPSDTPPSDTPPSDTPLSDTPPSDTPLAGAGLAGTIYSSTRIRELLVAGDVAGAAQLLGRPYEVRGVVIEGDRRGRELGFPTANVAVPARSCMPADGIYAGSFVAADSPLGVVERIAAISLGRRPTFYESATTSLLEAYVLDFDGDLYGQDVRVSFAKHLRGELKFDSVDALVEQIERDVADVRRMMS